MFINPNRYDTEVKVHSVFWYGEIACGLIKSYTWIHACFFKFIIWVITRKILVVDAQ